MLKKGLIVLMASLCFNVSASERVQGTGVIDHVVDGDTYWIKADRRTDLSKVIINAKSQNYRLQKNTFKARILNINTEESVHRQKDKNTSFGKLVSVLVKKELNGKRITFICDGVGYYGRPLCSVYINKQDYALSLVNRGLSPYVTKYGAHFNNHKGYVSAELKAKRNRAGLWGPNKEQYVSELPVVDYSAQ
tara:strand:+ start:1156 stop:1731 length:576 start_codon:yes stop_codon:yes gene_type:complete